MWVAVIWATRFELSSDIARVFNFTSMHVVLVEVVSNIRLRKYYIIIMGVPLGFPLVLISKLHKHDATTIPKAIYACMPWCHFQKVYMCTRSCSVQNELYGILASFADVTESDYSL